jgi:hypothetical protein
MYPTKLDTICENLHVVLDLLLTRLQTMQKISLWISDVAFAALFLDVIAPAGPRPS